MIKEEDIEDVQESNETQIADFRLSVEKYSYKSEPPSTPTRNRKSSRLIAEVVIPYSPPISPRKRQSLADDLSPDKLKRRRGYAPPETYAHLDYLTDCLAENLEVMFCGINPGVRSAEVGHHFAHPTNQFYRMLYGSGLTDRLISPSEDNTLPELYSLGITDLVDRPSASADQLSDKEMRESVPTLLEKIVRWKPRIICFVGKGMWLNAEKGIKHIIKDKQAREAREVPKSRSSSPKKSPARSRSSNDQKEGRALAERAGTRSEFFDLGLGLRPYKVVHSTDSNSESCVRETLFFCSPSSSGLVTSMNLAKKIELYKVLRENVQQHKESSIDTSWMIEVPV